MFNGNFLGCLIILDFSFIFLMPMSGFGAKRSDPLPFAA